MCGIVGFYGFKDNRLLRKMMDSVSHRGPDQEGTYTDNHTSLGHKRLSIIDLSKKGKQPIHNEDKTVWITYNGEIYNFQEIRSDLEKKGHKFSSKTDTEVIVHAYEEYKEDCLNLFNGMFAFALWDKKNKTLFIARDRIGIKPLYYYHKENKLIFASEIKAILQDNSIKREANNHAIIDYLTFQNILDNKTFFKGINLLMPGECITIKQGKFTLKRYWQPDYTKNNISEKEAVKEFTKIFKESVKRNLISDVPLGVFLSGGFDSSSVAYQTAQFRSSRIDTFTARFDAGTKYDESPFAIDVSKKINSKSHTLTINPEDFKTSIKDLIYHLDEPKVGMPAFSQYCLSKLVSKHVKVALSGDGGDELFAGYPVYKAEYFKEMVRKNPLNVFKFPFFFKLSELPRSLYFMFYPIFDKEVRPGLFTIFNKSQRDKILTKQFKKSTANHNPISTINIPKLSRLNSIQYNYLKTYLPSMLIVTDKVTMAHSIESRVPVCDNELVDFATKLPMEIKLYKKELKHIIKRAMKGKLPSSLYNRPKTGFQTPLSLWFRKDLKSFIYNILLDEKTKQRGIFNMKEVKHLLDRHCNARTDTLFDLVNAAKIWSLLNVELWFRIFIDGDYHK